MRAEQHEVGDDEIKAQIMNDLNGLIADADRLMKHIANATAEELIATRTGVQERLSEAKLRIDSVLEREAQRACSIVGKCENTISRNLWRTIGITAVAGIVIGLLLKRR